MRKSFSQIYSGRYIFAPETVYSQKREYLATENIDFEGRAVQGTVIKIDDPATRYNGLTANDFCLENQLAVGVALNPVKCSLVNSFEEDSQIK